MQATGYLYRLLKAPLYPQYLDEEVPGRVIGPGRGLPDRKAARGTITQSHLCPGYCRFRVQFFISALGKDRLNFESNGVS